MPMLAPRIQTDVWKTIKNYHSHNASNWETQYRKEMGIPDDQPLPPMGGGEYPKMMYAEQYFSTDDADERGNFAQIVHSKDQEDSLASDGWHANLGSAKKAYFASKEQAKKK